MLIKQKKQFNEMVEKEQKVMKYAVRQSGVDRSNLLKCISNRKNDNNDFLESEVHIVLNLDEN